MALVLGLGAGAAGAAVIGAPPYVTRDRPDLYRLVLLAGAERLVPLSRAPNFKLVREAAQQLAARGAQAAQRGDETAALTDWLAVLRLSCALGRGSAHARPGCASSNANARSTSCARRAPACLRSDSGS